MEHIMSIFIENHVDWFLLALILLCIYVMGLVYRVLPANL